jgi:hypothetical protein
VHVYSLMLLFQPSPSPSSSLQSQPKGKKVLEYVKSGAGRRLRHRFFFSPNRIWLATGVEKTVWTRRAGGPGDL